MLALRADEAAATLGLTRPAVHSLLHRARASLARFRAAHGPGAEGRPTAADEATSVLLERYVQVWEAADIDGFLRLLKAECALAMPPSPSWYAGRAAIGRFAGATIFADAVAPFFPGAARGRWRLVPTRANGQPAFGLYQRDADGHAYHALALQALAVEAGQVAQITLFMQPELFDAFGLPATLDD